jgi:hypothetical protein
VGLDLEPLEVVVDAEAARHAGSVLLFPAHGSNVAGHFAAERRPDSQDASLALSRHPQAALVESQLVLAQCGQYLQTKGLHR